MVNINKYKENLKRNNITIEDIRSTYPEEKGSVERYNLFGYFVLRRISYYLAWLFIRLSISANKVTGISILIGCVGCILLAFGSYTSMIIGALILNIWALFEYVDGNVARATNSCSNYGALLDDLNCFFISAIFFISTGIGAFNHPDSSLSSFIRFFLDVNTDKNTFLILGGLASSFYILPRLMSALFAKYSAKNRDDFVAITEKDSHSNILYKIGWYNINNVTGLIMPILLLAVIFRFSSFFIFFCVIVTICAFIGSTVLKLRDAKNQEQNK